LLVRGEGVGLASGQVKRLDEERGSPLPQGLFGDQGAEFRQHLVVAAECEVRLDAILDGGGP
jgi:hypothetical protein